MNQFCFLNKYFRLKSPSRLLHWPAMLDIGKLKALRAKLGLTQEQAAKRAGLKSAQHWAGIESGVKANVTVETLGKLAKALKCNQCELLK
jgi:DNA-binding XRE family transcriptional regulator